MGHIKQCLLFFAAITYLGILLNLMQTRNMYSNIWTHQITRQDMKQYTVNNVFFVSRKLYHISTNYIIHGYGYNVSVIHNPTHLCSNTEDNMEEEEQPFVLVIVHSAVDNRPQRDAIRNTWGKHLRDNQAVLVFLIGSTYESGLMGKVFRESKAYQDILLLDILDTYRNLTLKSLLGLTWIETFCDSFQYVIKTDDDSYVNVRSVISDIKSNPLFYNNGLVGSLNSKAKVYRHGIWNLSYEEHPMDYFPPYCSGNMYLLAMSVIQQLVNSSRILSMDIQILKENIKNDNYSLTEIAKIKVPMLPLEDVYITGYMAKHIHVQCQGHARFPQWLTGPSHHNLCLLQNGTYFSLHNVNYKMMYNVEKSLNSLTHMDHIINKKTCKM